MHLTAHQKNTQFYYYHACITKQIKNLQAKERQEMW